MHAILKKMLLRVMPLINLDSVKNSNFLFEELQQAQSRISVSTFANLFQSAVQIAQSKNTGNFPTVRANRGIVPAEQRNREKTVFFQIFQQVAALLLFQIIDDGIHRRRITEGVTLFSLIRIICYEWLSYQ